MNDVGVVAVGRNEGERFQRCLRSLSGQGLTIVYVDSASTDGSPEFARASGAEVIELDMTVPITIARARSEGYERLLAVNPGVRFVQFVDGDCELAPGWLDRARLEMEQRPEAAVVCGRRRERHPERSLYNRLADIEWDRPLGETDACGGDALMRVEALREAGGYNPAVAIGEEAELCFRLREKGWKVIRIDAEMTVHDMAMTRFVQWWKRTVRTGYGYAEGALRHGRSPERHMVPQNRSIVFWGAALPLTALALAWPTRGVSLVLFAGYPLLYSRIIRRLRGANWTARDARDYALFCVLGKFPQAIGLGRFWVRRLLGMHAGRFDYKDPGQARPGSVPARG